MSKTIRKNLAYLDDEILGSDESIPPPVDLSTDDLKRKTMLGYRGSEMDRYMIALLRLQTEGRVAYRRLLGMHGGGFGTLRDKEQIQAWQSSGKKKSTRPLMMVKAELDKNQVILEDWESRHSTQNEDDNGEWPSPQQNVIPQKLEKDKEYLAHIFCWHNQSPFLSWHRPLMVEFERLLQEYDPLFPKIHHGSDALGAHYYDWDGWDGMTLPPFINYPTYKIKTSVFNHRLIEVEGYQRNENIIPNPLYRWFAPMLHHHQLNETFPREITDKNCTTRDPAFSDISGATSFYYSFSKNDKSGELSIETSIDKAMNEEDYLAFCTITHNGSSSIEHAHNSFHNRIGGSDGTMSPLQSSFDPIFFVHHSNIERQFLSWQKFWVKKSWIKRRRRESSLPKWLMDTRLYPWTKPNLVKKGSLSWNTPADVDEHGNAAKNTVNDATVGDWWDYEQLEYEYDEYVPVTKPRRVGGRSSAPKVLMTIWMPVLTSGKYNLCLSNTDSEVPIDSVSIITGNNPPDSGTTTCSQCQKRSHLTLVFDVTGFVTPFDLKNYKSKKKAFEDLKALVIYNLFVRHKGQKYNVSNDDPSKSITVKSVRDSKHHMKMIRRELEQRGKSIEMENNDGFNWNCFDVTSA